MQKLLIPHVPERLTQGGCIVFDTGSGREKRTLRVRAGQKLIGFHFVAEIRDFIHANLRD